MNIMRMRTLSLTLLVSLSLVYDYPVAVVAWAIAVGALLITRRALGVVLGI